MIPILAALALAQDWTEYRCETYGFSMLSPEGAELREREWSGGWGGMAGSYGGVELYGLALLGACVDRREIEKFGAKVSGIAEERWRRIDEGRDCGGWKWYRCCVARSEGTVVFGGYGTGPAGSYLLFLKTTAEDFEKHEADYLKWYRSVRLFAPRWAGRNWELYRSKDYGFSMLIPEGAKVTERERDGWGVLRIEFEGLDFLGIARLGEEACAEDLERAGVALTGIEAWERKDRGEHRCGWKWYRTVRATCQDRLWLGGYGVGRKGSYLLVLRTTEEDVRKHGADYARWYRSVVLD